MTNALLGNAFAAYDSRAADTFPLDSEIRRLINIYGKAPVRDAAKRLTAMKQGRKPEKDWQELEEWIEMDARDWLDGRDPFSIRSNYHIAKAISEAKRGQSQIATHRRISKKLSQRRTLFMLMSAWNIAEVNRPFADYFRVCETLAATGAVFAQSITSLADSYRGQIERYRARFGEPDPAMTIKEIEKALLEPLKLGEFAKPGLFGLMRQP